MKKLSQNKHASNIFRFIFQNNCITPTTRMEGPEYQGKYEVRTECLSGLNDLAAEMIDQKTGFLYGKIYEIITGIDNFVATGPKNQRTCVTRDQDINIREICGYLETQGLDVDQFSGGTKVSFDNDTNLLSIIAPNGRIKTYELSPCGNTQPTNETQTQNNWTDIPRGLTSCKTQGRSASRDLDTNDWAFLINLGKKKNLTSKYVKWFTNGNGEKTSQYDPDTEYIVYNEIKADGTKVHLHITEEEKGKTGKPKIEETNEQKKIEENKKLEIEIKKIEADIKVLKTKKSQNIAAQSKAITSRESFKKIESTYTLLLKDVNKKNRIGKIFRSGNNIDSSKRFTLYMELITAVKNIPDPTIQASIKNIKFIIPVSRRQKLGRNDAKEFLKKLESLQHDGQDLNLKTYAITNHATLNNKITALQAEQAQTKTQITTKEEELRTKKDQLQPSG
jgi:hypothetical protein